MEDDDVEEDEESPDPVELSPPTPKRPKKASGGRKAITATSSKFVNYVKAVTGEQCSGLRDFR